MATLRLPYELSGTEASTATRSASAWPGIGLLSYQDDDEFKNRFLLLDSLGSWSIIVLGDPGRFEQLNERFPLDVRQETTTRCISSRNLLSDICKSLQRAIAPENPEQSRETTVTRFLRAQGIFELIETFFGHNRRLDITNWVLGPIRMMLTSSVAERLTLPDLNPHQRDVLSRFEQLVIYRLLETPHLYGELGRALTVSFDEVKVGIESGEPRDRKALLSSFDALLSCLTKSREHAGRYTTTSDWPLTEARVAPLKPAGKRRARTRFRILVIDDFAFTWRPALEGVSAALEQMELPTVFEFSVDGKSVARGRRDIVPLDEALPTYDLVVLDIFLGRENGLQLLERVRNRFLWLPVILWTTSVASELPAQAQLANGFIFKKRDTSEHIVNLVARWLREGNARRDVGLSNRLFDTTLRSLHYRQCAITFEKTCLKILDSFHALDTSYFRLYTDHGGRHIQRLLHILERLISPFLWSPDEKTDNVFSALPAERERELFQLHLAVLCHEMGMFPLRPEKQPPTNAACLDAIRVSHAVRGMLALMEGTYRPRELDEAVRALAKVGEDASRILVAVAILTGYHSRLLDIGKASFLHTVGENGRKKLNAASGSCRESRIKVPSADNVDKLLVDSAKTLFGAESSTAPARERLRKHCALLRFADALDVDHTRTPIEFLLFDPRRNHLTIREHVKREVLEDIEFTPSGIRLHFNAPVPDAERLGDLLGERSGIRNCRAAPAEPLSPESREWLRSCQPLLDRWLANYWFQVLSARPLSALSDEQRLERKRQEDFLADGLPKLNADDFFSQSGRAMIASMTALSVAGEIVVEFTAIEECGLEGSVKLRGVTWKRRFNWNGLPLLSFISSPPIDPTASQTRLAHHTHPTEALAREEEPS